MTDENENLDIVELLEQLKVSWHQQAIIDQAVDEICTLREALQQMVVKSKEAPNAV